MNLPPLFFMPICSLSFHTDPRRLPSAAPLLPAPLADLLVYAADAEARAVFEAALDMIPRVFGATKVRPVSPCVWGGSDDGIHGRVHWLYQICSGVSP